MHMNACVCVCVCVYVCSSQGQDGFIGDRIHARDLKPDLEFHGKDVIMVGNSVSVFDTLADHAVGQEAESVTLLYRKVRLGMSYTCCTSSHASRESICAQLSCACSDENTTQ